MAQAKLGVLEEEPEHSFSLDTKFLIQDEVKDTTQEYMDTHVKFFPEVKPSVVRPKEVLKGSFDGPKKIDDPLHGVRIKAPVTPSGHSPLRCLKSQR